MGHGLLARGRIAEAFAVDAGWAGTTIGPTTGGGTRQRHVLGAAASQTRRFRMAQPTIDPTFYRTAAEAAAAPGRTARLRGGLRPGRAEERRNDRHRCESGLRQLWAGGRLDRRPGPRRRAAPLRLERLQQRAQARGPQHGRPRPPLPPGAGPALVEHLRARHRAGPSPADAGQDDRRASAVRKGRLLPPAHAALRTRRGLPHLPGRRRGRRRRTGRDRAARPRDASTSCAPGRPTAGRSTSTTTPGGTSTRTC